jgi:hypothetical protein
MIVKSILTLGVCVLMCAGCAKNAQETSTTQSKTQSQAQNQPKEIYNEVDTTDIFAIPLDNDQLEEQEEEKTLESMQWKNTKPASAPKSN